MTDINRLASTASVDGGGEARYKEALEKIAGNNWKDQSRAKHVARAALRALEDTAIKPDAGDGGVERLRDALADLSDLFAHDGENSLERFERLAGMFRKDTGYLAPGKDQPMGGADQPDGNELRAIYDAWYQAKVDRARAALSGDRA